MITQIRLKEMFYYNPDSGLFIRKISTAQNAKAGDIAGSLRPDGYIKIAVDGVQYRAHRLAWLYVNGSLPPAEIDHINRIRSDNRIVNLRCVTRQQNNFNISSRKDASSKYVGVSFYKRTKRFQSQIKLDGKIKCLGYYATAEDAYTAYLAAKQELHII